ncbi:hypothetical protein [Salinicoccus roseus]|uniref:DUF7916 family protein n=1 Tax=Salinicoccus roseus TaxID=45670 RepID=UPI003569B357
MKRLLDCNASDFLNMTGQDLKKSIKASEGRTMLAETMATVPPLYPDVTNAELTASFGADLLLFNIFDVFNPEVRGFTPSNPNQVIHEIKRLTGRPVGLNPDSGPFWILLFSTTLSVFFSYIREKKMAEQ